MKKETPLTEAEITHAYLEKFTSDLGEVALNKENCLRVIQLGMERYHKLCEQETLLRTSIDTQLDEYYPIMPALGVVYGE